MCSLPAPSGRLTHSEYAIRHRWMDGGTLAAVDTEIESLPAALRARLVRLLELIEDVGLEELRAPQVRHLEGEMWELRVKSQAGIARGIYVTAAGRRLVLLHVLPRNRASFQRMC